MRVSVGNQSGQSLIQVMVAAAIMSVVTLGMASTINHMSVQSRALSEKLAALDLEKLLIASLSDGSVCNYLLKDKPFNSNLSLSTTSPVVISSPTRIYASYNPDPAATTPLGPVVAEVGQLASPYSESLKVSAIKMELTGRSGSSFTGRWRVDFDGTKLVRPIKPIYVSMTLGVDTADAANAKVTSCQGAGGTASTGSGGEWCGAFLGDAPGPYVWYGEVSGDASTPHVKTVIALCHGKTPGSPGPASRGYDLPADSLCPTGYTLTFVMGIGQYSPGDGVHGPGEVGGPSTGSINLYTCMH
jgi:hypothetical protein